MVLLPLCLLGGFLKTEKSKEKRKKGFVSFCEKKSFCNSRIGLSYSTGAGITPLFCLEKDSSKTVFFFKKKEKHGKIGILWPKFNKG